MQVKLNWEPIMKELGKLLIERLKKRVSVDTGDLKNSLSAEVKNTELVITGLFYMKYLEFGTLPHWTSHKNLIGWCERHLAGKSLNGKVLDAEQWSYVIQRHIAKYGTKPHPFIRDTIIQDGPELITLAIKNAYDNGLKPVTLINN